MKTSSAAIPIDVLDYDGAVERVILFVGGHRATTAYLVQSNAHTIVTAQDDPAYHEAVSTADLSLPDGMPLVWLLRLRGERLPGRVYGPDLMLRLCEEAASRNWRCFLLGGRPGVAELLGNVLRERFPGIQIVGTASPPFRSLSDDEDRALCDSINALAPDIVWVGLGSPKQDLWMYHHRQRLQARVLHGVGAAFDFLTGQVHQAPRWMMAAGLEWLYRLGQEPGRLWHRYTVTNARFLWYTATRRVIRPRHREL